MSWVKAVWEEENGDEVEGVIPSTWISGSVLWPNSSQARKFLAERKQPSQSWCKFKLKEIKSVSDDIDECRSGRFNVETNLFKNKWKMFSWVMRLLPNSFSTTSYFTSYQSDNRQLQTLSLENDDNKVQRHIMISYARKDFKLALEIYNKLSDNGYMVWINATQKVTNFRNVVADAVKNAYLVLVLVSSHYVASEACRREVSYAVDLKTTVVSVMVQESYKEENCLILNLQPEQTLHATEENFHKKLKEIINRNQPPRNVQTKLSRGTTQSPGSDLTVSGDEEQKHIMISYNWADSKQLAHKINDELCKAKYKVWIDKNEMHGPVFGKMAEAVENADLFLMFATKHYMTSENCQMEAAYAKDLKKTIIPIKVEQGYKPNNWLGLFCAKELYYDFSNCKFEEKFNELKAGIEKLQQARQPTDVEKIPKSSEKSDENTPNDIQTKTSKEVIVAQMGSDENQRHIMISYHWSSKELAHKLYDKLCNDGYKVWIDEDHMKGNIYDQMYEAVKNAFLVLMIHSSEYGRSENCRREALLASDLKKPIIPIIGDTSYKMNGWLALLTAGKLYWDFSKGSFEDHFRNLLKEIRRYSE
ncbi:unnamed protein product [Clavelina lepadiformis]|uniref:TIR domain-containing protein n=1 Tax=Clavelina lepadiformis TaxID=159417 RepID=A0ABP0FMF6_CLALP